MSSRPDLLALAARLRDQLARMEREVVDVEALASAGTSPDRTTLWAIAILRPETANALDPCRAFRHFFRHGYGVELDWAGMGSKALGIGGVHAEFARDAAAFCEFLDAAGLA